MTEKCSICGLTLGETYDNSLDGKFSHLPELFVDEKEREEYPDWFFHGCTSCKNEKTEKCTSCYDYCNFVPPMNKKEWELEMHKRRYHSKIYRII